MEQWIEGSSLSALNEFLSGSSLREGRGLVVVLVCIALVCGALLAFLSPVGGLAVLVAGLAAVLVLRDVRLGLLAVIGVACLLPFASLPFKIGFTPTFLDLAFGAVYAVWAVRLFTRTQNDFVLTPLGLPVLIFCLLAIFCFLLGLAHSFPTPNDLRTFAEVLMGIGIFFVVVNNVRCESTLRLVTRAIIAAGTAESLIGILFYVLPTAWTVRALNPLARLGYPVGYGALRYINDDPSRPMRAIGTSVDPNILGAMLVIILTITGVQLFARRPVMPRFWLALSAGSMAFCLFLTYSRGSLVGVAAALGAVAVLRYRRLLLVLVVMAMLLLLLPQTQDWVAHFVQGIGIEDRSTQMRMGEYRDAFKLIQRYPWLGVGFVGTPDIDLYLGVASIYFTLASQMGLIGLSAFLLVMIVFFVLLAQAVWVSSEHPTLEPMLLGYGAAVFGSLVSGALDHTLLTYPHAAAFLWLVLGLGVVCVRRIQSSRNFHGTAQY